VVEQLTGAGIGTIVALAYVLLLQVLMAAITLMCEFILLRFRELRKLLHAVEKPSGEVTPATELARTTEHYKVGGGVMRWE
jgi:hypothetical protein